MAKGSKGKPRSGFWRKHLWLSSLVGLVLAVLFYLAEFFFETRDWHKAANISQHLTTTFLVAIILTLSLEYNAKKRAHEELTEYREQVARDVFGAVLGRIVPEAIVSEITQILRMPFIKTECEYTIRFLKPYEGMNQDYCVLRRDLGFTVTNLLEEPRRFPVRSSYTSDEDLSSAVWMNRPFHLELLVNGQAIPPADFLRENGFVMDYEIALGPGESAKVFLRGEEPMRVEASSSFYYQNTPVTSIRVSIENNYPEAIGPIEVQMHHPGREQVERDKLGERYFLDRAFIPGQGFAVMWKKA